MTGHFILSGVLKQTMEGKDSRWAERPLFNESVFLSVIKELQHLYQGFPLESQIWARDGHRRSPYRALILFGLSPRTRDWLLVDMCRRFFAEFPDLASFLASGSTQFQTPRSMIRAGQVPFIESAAEIILQNFHEVPRDAPTLLRIKGVGAKVAECVLGYGWGREALPVDANVCRLVSRLGGLPEGNGRQLASLVRERLKEFFNFYRPRLSALNISMIDAHELLRLHGQVVCTAAPKCWRCPLSRCRSRQSRNATSGQPVIDAALWADWRELLLDPGCGNIRENQPMVRQATGGGYEP